MMAYTSEDIKYHDMTKMYDTMKKLKYSELVDVLDNVQELLDKKKEEYRDKVINNFLDAYEELSKADIDVYCTCHYCNEEVLLSKDSLDFV